MPRPAPLVSFILVAGSEPPDLVACGARLLGPELAAAEVLVVGGEAGPAGLDPRIRVLPPARGEDAARDLGLAEAMGDYVWFVDPAGGPAPGAVAAVAERLRAVCPDVLVLEGERPRRRLLERVARDGAASLDERPGLAAVAPQLGDKVLRRAHLRRLGVRFGAGARGELPVTWPALLTAQRVAAAPGARCLGPRPPRPTGADLAGAYAAVFAFIDAHPGVTDERRRLVLPAMLRHELAALGRLPPADRPAAFAAVSAVWRAHRRGDEAVRGDRAVSAVQRGSYRAYQALEAARSARRALARPRSRVIRTRRTVRRRQLERHYRRRLEAPIDPRLAVFAAYWYRGYACNPRSVYEKARELVPDMRGVWVVKRDAADTLPAGVEYVVAGTPEYYDTIARGRVFVNNVNFPNHFVKRDGTVHVMTHHGTPLKTMGLDLRESPIVGPKMDFDALLRRCARWDYSVSSNPFSTAVWERVYPTSYETLEVGYPRNDVLAGAAEPAVRRAREHLGIDPGRVAVLYAPTHREFRSSYVPVLDVAAVAEALGDEHVLLVRAHYFYGSDRRLAELHRDGRIRDVAAHPSVEELCLAADVLVTDYSSVMFDYAVLDRPIVIHAPDWEAYRALRGTYLDLMTEHPGVVVRTEAELISALRSGAARAERATEARAAFRARFCALEDGRAAERVVRRVWLNEREAAESRRAPVAE